MDLGRPNQTPRNKKRKVLLLSVFMCYLAGCIGWYFLWYKNGQFLHITIIALTIGGAMCTIGLCKAYFLRKNKSLQTFIVIFLIILLMGFAAFVSSLEKKRVESILNNEPVKQATAVVVAVEFRSTRSGKQAWSIINYKVNNQVIEQSFADTSKNLSLGRKYIVEYSLKYPDMYRIVKTLE